MRTAASSRPSRSTVSTRSRDRCSVDRGTGTREKDAEWKVTIPGIGVFDASSVSWGGTLGGDEPPVRDVSVVGTVGAHSAKLQEALLTGKPVDVVIVHKSGLTISVKKGLVSSYSVTGGTDQAAVEHWTVSPPKPKKRLSEDGSESE